MTEDRIQALLSWLATQPAGASSADCAKVLGLSESRARCHFGRIGMVCVQASTLTRWCLPHQVEEARKEQDKRRKAYAVKQRKGPKLDRKAYLDSLIEAADLPIRRPILDARTAPPIPKTGPASVWELAA